MNFDRLGSEFLGFQMNTPLTGASGTFGFGSAVCSIVSAWKIRG